MGYKHTAGVTALASSCDGHIKLWRIDSDRLSPVSLMGSVDTQCRVTCLTAWHPGLRNPGKKRKKEETVEVNVTPKKVKISEGKAAKSAVVDTVTETEEVSKPKTEKKKFKKKKKAGTEVAPSPEVAALAS